MMNETQSLLNKLRSNRIILFYCLGFLVLAITVSWLIGQNFFYPIRQTINSSYASIAALVLSIIGQGVSASGDSITGDGFSVQIRKGCDAIAPMILYASSIAVFPMFSWMKKIRGIAYGLVLMILGNLVRIISLYLIGKYANDWFDFFHVNFWQVVYIIFTVMLWLYWLNWANKTEPSS